MTITLEKTRQLSETQTVERYFQTFNASNFGETVHLFAETGQLLPPFEEPVVGRVAIQAYLEREAMGMQANPQKLAVEQDVDGYKRVTVSGSVKALVFVVNVAWIFKLDPQEKIQQVEVKLLASLQELLNLRST